MSSPYAYNKKYVDKYSEKKARLTVVVNPDTKADMLQLKRDSGQAWDDLLKDIIHLLKWKLK